MKKALVVALVVLLVVIGLPVLMPGMGGAPRADCSPATLIGAMCVAVLALAASVMLAALRRRAALEPDRRRDRLLGSQLYRPPRLALVR